MWTIGIVLIIATVFIIYRFASTKKENLSLNETSNNVIEISKAEDGSDEVVTDGCLEEWEDYSRYVGERIEEASNNYAEDDTHYLLKDVLGYIEVYYLGENNEEILYKKTTIPTAYLSQEDIEDLKVGIEVIGAEELNKTLEDFE